MFFIDFIALVEFNRTPCERENGLSMRLSYINKGKRKKKKQKLYFKKLKLPPSIKVPC